MKVVREHNGKYYLIEYHDVQGWYGVEISFEAFKLLEHIDYLNDFHSIDWIED
ncbi:hypothetical protein [Bacillus cereus]|uniref:hypothetical protein n=1 Tax=Bacillus cereus TaxID=1396 RepID=UPI0018F2EFE2|nr:hypothetical protein [Bacillus cereus]MBJ7955832.1 hypothetical protein [Bacillus cereus]